MLRLQLWGEGFMLRLLWVVRGVYVAFVVGGKRCLRCVCSG